MVVGIQEQIESLGFLGWLDCLGRDFELAEGLRNPDLFLGEDPGSVLCGAVLRRISFSFQHQEEFL